MCQTSIGGRFLLDMSHPFVTERAQNMEFMQAQKIRTFELLVKFWTSRRYGSRRVTFRGQDYLADAAAADDNRFNSSYVK
jgi:hypothetical protein